MSGHAELATLEFGPFAPDLPDFKNPGIEEARNVLPLARGYAPLRSFQTYSNPLSSRCIGGISVKDSAGNALNYAGTQGDLWQLSGSTWNNAGTGFSNAMPQWDFTQFQDQVIACGLGSNIQKVDIGQPTFAQLIDFEAATCATVRNFVMVGSTQDSTDGLQPSRVRWSARGDSSDWTPSATTLSGFQPLDTPGGAIRKIIGGEFATIFQERAVVRATYTGATVGTTPIVWQFDEVERGVGSIAPRSVVQFGSLIAFWAEDGFRVFDGNRSEPIDDTNIGRSVLRDLDQSFIDRITGAVDVDEQTVYWAYPGPGNLNGTPNRLAIWRWRINRWSFADDDVDHFMQSATPFVDIDTDVGPEDVSAEAAGSLDDKVWAGGNYQIGAIVKSGELSYLDGPFRTGTLTTREDQLQMGRRAFVRDGRALVDGTLCEGGDAMTMAIGHRNCQAAPVVWTDDVPRATDGTFKFRVLSRYARVRVNIPGGFKDASGVVLRGRVAGTR